MPTTSSHLLPYPEASDPADVPADIAALAEAVDTKLDAIAPAQITGPTSGQLLIANASGVVTGTAVSGDVVISNTGDAQIQAGAVGTNELGNSAVTTAKIDNGAVTTAKIGDSQVTTAKINNGAITTAKIEASTTDTATNASGVTGTLTARKYAGGLVILSGSLTLSPAKSATELIATLPAGYRPTSGLLNVPVVSGAAGAVNIGGTGEIRVSTGSANLTAAPLSHVSFHAS